MKLIKITPQMKIYIICVCPKFDKVRSSSNCRTNIHWNIWWFLKNKISVSFEKSKKKRERETFPILFGRGIGNVVLLTVKLKLIGQTWTGGAAVWGIVINWIEFFLSSNSAISNVIVIILSLSARFANSLREAKFFTYFRKGE